MSYSIFSALRQQFKWNFISCTFFKHAEALEWKVKKLVFYKSFMKKGCKHRMFSDKGILLHHRHIYLHPLAFDMFPHPRNLGTLKDLEDLRYFSSTVILLKWIEIPIQLSGFFQFRKFSYCNKKKWLPLISVVVFSSVTLFRGFSCLTFSSEYSSYSVSMLPMTKAMQAKRTMKAERMLKEVSYIWK